MSKKVKVLRSFRHEGKAVKIGKTVTLGNNIAAELINVGKAKLVSGDGDKAGAMSTENSGAVVDGKKK